MTTNCMLAHRHIKLKKVRGEEEMTRNDKLQSQLRLMG